MADQGKSLRRPERPTTPGLGGGERAGTELQYGDVQRLERAQRVAPLPRGVPSPAPGGGAPTRRLQGEQLRQRPIPRHLLEMGPESEEPTTTGLARGPGAGPEVLESPSPAEDMREAVLEYSWLALGNADARAMLYQLRQEKAAAIEQERQAVQAARPGLDTFGGSNKQVPVQGEAAKVPPEEEEQTPALSP